MNSSQRARAIAALERNPFEPVVMTTSIEGFHTFQPATKVAESRFYHLENATGLL